MTTEENLARWQGRMEAQVEGLEARTSDLERAVANIDKALTAVRVQIASLKTMVGIWSAVGGVIGAGITSGLIILITGGK